MYKLFKTVHPFHYHLEKRMYFYTLNTKELSNIERGWLPQTGVEDNEKNVIFTHGILDQFICNQKTLTRNYLDVLSREELKNTDNIPISINLCFIKLNYRTGHFNYHNTSFFTLYSYSNTPNNFLMDVYRTVYETLDNYYFDISSIIEDGIDNPNEDIQIYGDDWVEDLNIDSYISVFKKIENRVEKFPPSLKDRVLNLFNEVIVFNLLGNSYQITVPIIISPFTEVYDKTNLTTDEVYFNNVSSLTLEKTHLFNNLVTLDKFVENLSSKEPDEEQIDSLRKLLKEPCPNLIPPSIIPYKKEDNYWGIPVTCYSTPR